MKKLKGILYGCTIMIGIKFVSRDDTAFLINMVAASVVTCGIYVFYKE